MTKTSMNLLFISQGKDDDALIKKVLHKYTDSSLTLHRHEGCQSLSDIATNQFDAVLVSTAHSFKKALGCIRHCHVALKSLPVITITNEDHPSIYQLVLQAGATDTIPVDHLTFTLLKHSVHYVVRQKVDEARLLKLAHYDPLTGATNPTLFYEKLTEHIAYSRRSNHLLAVLLVDLDGFKSVNHRLGHAEGDNLLIKACERLKNSIRETDTLARIKADQFAITATQLHSADDAATLANAILESCQFVVKDDYDELHISCSIGIALFPNDEYSAHALLLRAEDALLHAKRKGKACFHYADSDANVSNQRQQTLIEELGTALLCKQFTLLFQPIVSIDDEIVCRTEVLLRWNHPQHGMLAPEHFLPLAKRCGLIQAIGRWVVDTACRQQLNWQRQGLPPVPLAINLSAPEYCHHKLLHHIHNLPKTLAFDLNQLHLELNETDLIDCDHQVCEQLCELHDQGVHLTVDNFGKDYSSLRQLHKLPVDCLKIDRSVTQRIPYDNEDLRVTEAIIQLSKIMDIEVVAQGVEDPLTIPSLLEKECTLLQGYAIGEPMSGEQFPIWHSNYTRQFYQTALH